MWVTSYHSETYRFHVIITGDDDVWSALIGIQLPLLLLDQWRTLVFVDSGKYERKFNQSRENQTLFLIYSTLRSN